MLHADDGIDVLLRKVCYRFQKGAEEVLVLRYL